MTTISIMTILKHWKFFAQTKDFLRERYSKYHILQGPTLAFDCLVRKYQPSIFSKSYQDEHGNPVFYEVNDSYGLFLLLRNVPGGWMEEGKFQEPAFYVKRCSAHGEHA
ncbi:MAG: hypothetical protein ACLQPD_29775 [Desulfomonilaceae bacterium]